MEPDHWEYLRIVVQVFVIPLMGWFIWGHKKQVEKIDTLEKRISEAEIDIEVTKAQLTYLNQSISRIEHNIDKLLDLIQRAK